MGVYINLDIVPSKIDKEEWESVYLESLELIKAYPLASIIREDIGRSKRLVLEKAREQGYGENRFWSVSGDIESKQIGENFILYKNLEKYSRGNGAINKDILQVIMKAREGLSTVFDSKTQGEEYHFYILSIAALIEDRLKGRAIVYGDFTKEQAEKAINFANNILKEPIKLPVRVDEGELLKRLEELSIKNLSNFLDLYITENKDGLCEFIRENFSEQEIMNYFKSGLKEYNSATQLGAERIMIRFLNMGYSLEELSNVCCLDEGGPKYNGEEFIKALGSTWVFVEKEYRENMSIFVKEAVKPQYVEYQFGTAFLDMCGLLGRYCNRYITMEEGIKILRDKLGYINGLEEIVQGKYNEAVEVLKKYGKELDDIKTEYSETIEKNIIMDYDVLLKWDDSLEIADFIENNIKSILMQMKETITDENYKVVSIINSLSTKEEILEIMMDFLNKVNLILSREAWNWIDEIEDLKLCRFITLMIGLCSDSEVKSVVRAILENEKLFNKYVKLED
ncbi:hypothetical protein I6U48_26515 [Clostridium sp. PL3]|uniref:Uncharacterized protein n=1 Tax=Clostridium thailandense TaxID=2794346 RepID=A0A949X5Z8_9CLOT|nr:hypothetical protein [Clostridium thailandense]MBV7276438.1 hypothetical protein [Clostridium thailandense]